MTEEFNPLTLEGDEQEVFIVDNFVRGINRSRAGAIQAVTEFQEMLGIIPVGSSKAETQKLKGDLDVLKSTTLEASRGEGAGASELAGEILPLLVAPLGGTVLRAGAIGGGVSSGFFQEDVDESRIPAQLTGAALGAGARGLFNLFKRGDPDINLGLNQKLLTGPKAQQALPQGPIPANRALVPQGRALAPNQGLVQGGQSPFRFNLSNNRFPTSPRQAPGAPQRALTGRSPTQAALPPGGGARAVRGIQEATGGARNLAKQSAQARKTAANKLSDFIKAANAKAAKLKKAAAKAKTTRTKKAVAAKAVKAAEQAQAAKVLKGVIAKSIEKGVKEAPIQKATESLTPAELKMTRADLETAIVNANPHTAIARGTKKADLQEQLRVAKSSKLGKGQAGEIDPQLLAAGGGAALGGSIGAAANPDNPLVGAVGGALTGGLGVLAAARVLTRGGGERLATHSARAPLREASAKASKFVGDMNKAIKSGNFTPQAFIDMRAGAHKVLDEFLGATMFRLEKLAPKIATGLKEAEFRQHFLSGQWMTRGKDNFKVIKQAGLSDAQAKTLKIKLLNSTDRAEIYLNRIGKAGAAAAVRDLDSMMKDMGSYLSTVGLDKGLRKNYFPRMVTDVSQFEKIEEVRTLFRSLAKKKQKANLNDFEKEIALTQAINGVLHQSGKAGKFARAASGLKRRTTKVDSTNVDAYADLQEGMNDYIEQITSQVERRNFFKGQGVKIDDLGTNSENLDSVAQRLKVQLKDGKITDDQLEEVAVLIAHRFGPGEQAPAKWIQNFKNLTYAGLLGNPISAATQLGDIALGLHRNGVRNTAEAIAIQLTKKGHPLRQLDKEGLLGIRNAATDFASRTKTRDVLNFTLRYSGFQAVDRFGKNTYIQGAMLRNQKMSKPEFMQKWGKIFDPDGGTQRTAKVFDDVQNYKGLTPQNREDIGFMLWNELQEVQPIAISAMPQRYLQHPDGRMAFMLQSFTLKLFDVMRRDIIAEFAKGNIRKGTEQLVSLSSFFVLTNSGADVIKNFMLGRDAEGMDLVVNNFLKLAGMNKFMFDKVKSEGFGQVLGDTILPPTALIDAAGAAVVGDFKKGTKLLPFGGKFLAEGIE